jgi:hypothetical protein
MLRDMTTALHVLRHIPRPMLHWAPDTDNTGFVARYRGEDWHLTRTPKARYPWLLHSGTSRITQEIGVDGPREARHAVEIWLDMSYLLPQSLMAGRPGT